MIWRAARRDIVISGPLVMAILNATPDSFSDRGETYGIDAAIRRAERFVKEGADILDIGGESTRPGSTRVGSDEEIRRVVPVIQELTKRFDIPISVDTSKSEVASAALDAGAVIINDISGLRFDERIGEVVADKRAGLVLMHSRGEFESLHSQPTVSDILDDVAADFRRSLATAQRFGISPQQIVLDVGIGFGKTGEQNFELIAKLDKLITEFPQFPFLVGTSRKSFIGKLLDDAPADKRLSGSLATVAMSIWNGASILRVHDVKETVETIKIIEAIREQL